jgi:hypothetical protein
VAIAWIVVLHVLNFAPAIGVTDHPTELDFDVTARFISSERGWKNLAK